MLFPASLLVVPLLTYPVFAQTYTDCDPTKKCTFDGCSCICTMCLTSSIESLTLPSMPG